MKKKLFSYLGFTPTEHSSGDNIRYGHISRQWSSYIKIHLIEAASIAIKKDSSLEKIYQQIKNCRGAKIAIVGVARRPAGRLRSCLKCGKHKVVNVVKQYIFVTFL